jgi:hypothetical protein
MWARPFGRPGLRPQGTQKSESQKSGEFGVGRPMPGIAKDRGSNRATAPGSILAGIKAGDAAEVLGAAQDSG